MTEKLKIRERIEWTNTWREFANDKNKIRILLIGDSVTRGIRSSLQERVGERYAIDLFANSYSITDEAFIIDVKNFLSHEEYEYSLIVLQCGLQHGYYRYCHEDKEFLGIWESSLDTMVEQISEYCNNIVFASGTPQVYTEDITKLHVKNNMEIETRNMIMSKKAYNMKREYIDLYFAMLSDGEHIDRQHFKKKDYDTIAILLEEVIERNLIQLYDGIIEKNEITIFYGTGCDALYIYTHLKEKNRKKIIICDRKAKDRSYKWNNQSVYSPDKILEKYDKSPIIITSYKYGDEILNEIIERKGESIKENIFVNRVSYNGRI